MYDSSFESSLEFASKVDLDIQPSTLDFGLLPQNERQIRTVTVTKLGAPPESASATCHELTPWFSILRSESPDESELFPLRIVVAVATESLRLGQRYETRLTVTVDESSVDIPVIVDVGPPAATFGAVILERCQIPAKFLVIMALAILLIAFYSLVPVAASALFESQILPSWFRPSSTLPAQMVMTPLAHLHWL